MARIAAAAGLPVRDFHSLRRFRASVASVLGIDPKVTQVQLGHANIATTLGIYTYTDDAQARAAAILVDRALVESPLESPSPQPDVVEGSIRA
jgi:integrase